MIRRIFIAVIMLSTLALYSQEKKLDEEKWSELVDGLNYNEEPREDAQVEPPQEYNRRSQPDLLPNTSLAPIQIISIVGVVVLLIIIIIALVDRDVFKSMLKKKALRVNIEDPDYLDASDLKQALINQSKTKDFKSCIRIYYLLLLEKLDAKRLIRWKKAKTNRQYIIEIRKNSIRKDLKRLTRVYEDVWFGEMLMDKNQYDYWALEFENAMKQTKG